MTATEFLCPELGCAYRWNSQYNSLEWCPMMKDGTLDTDNWGVVEEDLVGEETVTYGGRDVTLSEVYRDVERQLGVKRA